jgi:hypothetical protein
MKKIFLAVLVCLLLLVSFGETKPVRKPIEPTRTEFSYQLDLSKYAVYQGDLMSTEIKWLDTGIYIKKGMSFTIIANGSMFIAGETFEKFQVFAQCTPKGMDVDTHAFYYGMLRGRVINREAKHEYFFHIGERIRETNIQYEGKLEISVLPTPWINEGKWAVPSGQYNVDISTR